MICLCRFGRGTFIMAISKITICVFLAFVFFSVMLSKIQNTITIDESKSSLSRLKGQDDAPAGSYNTRLVKRSTLYENEPFPNDMLRHLMIFIQVSDLHISLFTDPARSTDLSKFCTEIVPLIKPSVVIASGDLTDGKTPDLFGSRQYVDEWKIYEKTLLDSKVLEKTVWLDIRGNHDNFNVPGLESNLNYYRQYSIQGKNHSRSYNYTLKQGNDIYSFIGIDACMEPGPKRPFNFLGVLSQDEYDKIKSMSNDAVRSNMTIWFGHYSTSTMVSPHPGIRELMRGTGPYLCGHLHTMGGLVPAMYTLQPTGNLELELSDWKETRKFRVGVVDHGLFSFIDVVFNRWPIVIVSNPKQALFAMPSVEPIERIKNSTHIRVIIFNPWPILGVKFQINNENWQDLTLIEKPLYVAVWNPRKYSNGLHTLRISVTNSSGDISETEHRFSLDGTRPSFPLMARMTLMGHVNAAQIVFGTLLVILVLPLCIFRCLYQLRKDDWIRRKAQNNWIRKQIFKFYLLAAVDRIFWPFILALVYVGTGPWFIGELIDGNIGAMFVWGLLIRGSFIPGGLTFVVGILHLVTFFLPMMFILSSCLYRHYRHLQNGGAPTCSLGVYLWRHIGMILVIMWQALCSIGYLLSYGYVAMLLGVLTTYSFALALVLWRFAVTLPEACFPRRDTARVDSKKENCGSEQVWAVDGDGAGQLTHQESKETLLRVSNPSTNALDLYQDVNASTHF